MRTLQECVQVVEEKQLNTHLVLQEHSKQLARLKAEMTERFEEKLSESGNKGKEDLSTTLSDTQKVRKLSYYNASCSPIAFYCAYFNVFV